MSNFLVIYEDPNRPQMNMFERVDTMTESIAVVSRWMKNEKNHRQGSKIIIVWEEEIKDISEHEAVVVWQWFKHQGDWAIGT
jgi:hypothetical protein